MIKYRNLALSTLLMAAAITPQICAANDFSSITGIWRTFDDETNQPAALIEITTKDGIYSGNIKRLLDPNSPALCDKCTDFRRGKPVLGMKILSDLKLTDGVYSGGQILDPDNGEIYRVEAKLIDQGFKLDVRAYIGIPLLGRTQTWVREK
ncbi:DUF2147 domain-containing protein [Polynucleobacter sp. 71A-WALBACH]|uniref:DUF2147 domain-containing protein n=1 Tax=Polynucleobacter sp. 71A-WALBACH TaxID=2689097 RepID=UPI002103B13B|nr:DUF2147 domain-containing protein [Polynucleobacter sp. 71A-WALBACH]